ncbi:asparaginase [Coccidioides posadasii str. Silveira]|uniref:Asparaginase n=1 Tax=Coccidioides posadasii (strain RMSCC 757 / Silveira) TaxID=443226 RepID=E9D2A8_COCPS|nr:asparaginase [Coccidioides posadasii str. Silveira]
MMVSASSEAKGISAIYVHAGAGFHSHQSEEIHLWVCNQAAILAMAVLKSGGSAVDAVEVAVKFLEDHEITNAGYGSNLTINGTVECDATIVDHLGRSGAVGAVEHVKNPITLARVILDASTKPLAFNRVPPNLIAGAGAIEFAYEQGISVLPANSLVSRGARERWFRWNHELQQLELQRQAKEWDPACRSPRKLSTARASQACVGSSPSSSHRSRRSANSPSNVGRMDLESGPDGSVRENLVCEMDVDTDAAISTIVDRNLPDDGASEPDANAESDPDYVDNVVHWEPVPSTSDTPANELPGECSGDIRAAYPPPIGLPPPSSATEAGTAPLQVESSGRFKRLNAQLLVGRDDDISDTVGAIAIDCYGNIAAGSSSGGIGMKHCGRTGPAALVGVGTAVVPVEPKDESATSAAAVTSGTGEHMATTMAAGLCVERIYSSIRKVPGKPGTFEEVTEDEALKAVIENEFMGHPGVKASHCHAAIGIMAVKRTTEGIAFFFGHNTDSFAIASMTSDDPEPCCLMSRNKGYSKVAQGGRYTRLNRSRYKPSKS